MKTNTPNISFKVFTDEWQEKKLGDITKINQGLQIAISKRHTSKVPNSYFYITNEFIKYGAKKQYFITNPPQSVICSPEDILMTRTGNTGKVLTGLSGAFHNNFFRIKYDKDISKNFLFYFLNLRKTQNLILRLAGTSTIPDLNHKDFYRIPIVLPTTTEQQKIANFLTVVDEKINKLEEKKKTLFKKYKKGVMQNLFPAKGETNPKIRFRPNANKDYPNWEEMKLGELLNYEQPTKYIVESTEYDGKHKTPVLTAGKTFILGYTDETDGIYNNLPVIIFDDFTTTSQFVNFPFKVKSSAMKILKPTKNANIKFIFEAIQQIKYEIGGHGRHWISKYSNIKVLVPSSTEQQKIADFLTSLDNKVDLINKKLEQAKEFKKGLLQKMFV